MFVFVCYKLIEIWLLTCISIGMKSAEKIPTTKQNAIIRHITGNIIWIIEWFFFWKNWLYIFFIYLNKKIIKWKLEYDFCYTRIIFNNEILVANNQNFIIEIDDDSLKAFGIHYWKQRGQWSKRKIYIFLEFYCIIF